jgi:hypothetical protein
MNSEGIPADNYDAETDGPKSMKRLWYDRDKTFDKSRRHERKTGGFTCSHCATFVSINTEMGTEHRNHCNACLWSKHVDNKPGDRASECQSGMEPIAVTLKIKGTDKYTGVQKSADVMLVHRCTGCDVHIINRIAADDSVLGILSVFEKSQSLPIKEQQLLQSEGISIMRGDEGRRIISERLYGK